MRQTKKFTVAQTLYLCPYLSSSRMSFYRKGKHGIKLHTVVLAAAAKQGISQLLAYQAE